VNEAYGITQFCDDIREEVNGKISLMGLYGDELIVFNALPAALPKLALVISARFPLEAVQARPVASLKVLIFFPEDGETPQIEFDVPWTLEPPQISEALPFPDATSQYTLNRHFVLSPFVIRQEGWLRVRIQWGEERVRVGALHILSRPQGPVTSASSPTG
jgi:hypothetical protein